MLRNLYRRADVLHGKCDDAPTVVEAVQFHGIRRTKNDALVKEIAHLYKCADFAALLRDADLAAKHLVEVGLMENATALIDVCEGNPHSYVVNFLVREPKPFIVGAKAGVSTYGEADGIVNASRSSAFGRGENFNSSYTYTVKGNQTFNVSFSKPFLGWQKYSNINFAVYRNFLLLPWNLSESGENGILMQFNKTISRNVQHTANVNLIWRKLIPLKEAAFSVREFAGHSLKFSVENSVAYDTRNCKIIPSKGVFCRFNQEYAGLLGDVWFAKHQLDLQAATPLCFGAFLAGSLQGSVISTLSSQPSHILDRLYLGGPLNLRGFGWNSLGSRAGNSCLGGTTSCTAVLHIYRPLVPADMLYAHGFVAAGSVVPADSFDRIRDLADERRVSAGVGLTFVFRNMLRLEINYALPLRYRSTDSCTAGFQFGAGINFM